MGGPLFVESRLSTLESDPTSLTQATIMMVDDQATNMEIMRGMLERAGYQRFILVKDSTRAIQEIEQCRPDILLLDLVMPGVSGLTILQQVRNHPKFSHLPVLILTGSTDSETKLRALDSGASDFLTKPVDPSELSLRIRNTLRALAYQNQLAYYDSLTNLPNRDLFLDQLAWDLERAQGNHEHLVLLHILLPKFKHVSNTLGPKISDEVMRQIAERIQTCVRGTDLVGKGVFKDKVLKALFRTDGDAFSVLCPNMSQVENATKVAARILKVMEAPFEADGREVCISPYIGIASYPDDATDMMSLIQCAVAASAQAKAHEQGGFAFYSSIVNRQLCQNLEQEADLHRAIDHEELVLHYQPKVNVKSGQISGVEALVRWQKPDGTLVLPNDFIPLAETTGLIVPMGNWVLRTACGQLARWQGQGIWIHVAVNLSVKQFYGTDFLQEVEETIKEHPIDPQYLTLELTESLLMENPEQAIEILDQLMALGLRVSLDDFGRGYSSLTYLKRLPLHELKLDRSFIKDLSSNVEDQALVTTVMYLAHEFGLQVVAEGVEEEAQLAMLTRLGCDDYQGNFFSRPVGVEDLAPLLSALRGGVRT
jgi:diguanylate cyclase (GGDEF)-like protein